MTGSAPSWFIHSKMVTGPGTNWEQHRLTTAPIETNALRLSQTGSQEQQQQRWRIVNELLHSKDSDKTRTDDENRRLCSTFAHLPITLLTK